MSDNIFKELCNRILNLFKQTESEEVNAKDVARNRLRVVLMQDRTNLTPELLQRMRRELVELLSKYVEMDKEALELNFDQEGDQMALMLSIPVIRAKDAAEIEEALAEEDEETEDDEDSEEDQAEDEEISEDENSEENANNQEEEANDSSEQEHSSDENQGAEEHQEEQPSEEYHNPEENNQENNN